MSTKDKGKVAVAKKAVKLERLKIEYVPVDSIFPNTYNPNRQSEHDFALLLKSIEEDGFTQPIIVHQEKRQIVDGEHRWRGARKLGYTEVPVVFVDMTPEQMRISTLRHNRARGDEDIDLTSQVLRDLQELGAIDWAQDSLMLSDEEINRMVQTVDVPDVLGVGEFSDAWEPSSERPTDAPQSSEAVSVKTGEGTVVCAGSTSAVDAVRDREKKLAEAKSEEEKAKVREETKIFRLNLVFSGGESDLIREVLGKHPAEKMVQMARYWVEHKLDGTPSSSQDGAQAAPAGTTPS